MALIRATVVTSQRKGVRAVDTIELTVLATAAANHQLTVCGEWLLLKDRQLVPMIMSITHKKSTADDFHLRLLMATLLSKMGKS